MRLAFFALIISVLTPSAMGQTTSQFTEQLKDLRSRINAQVPREHELAAYLDESCGIIQRLIAAINADAKLKTKHAKFEVEIQTAECKMLLAALTDELELIKQNTEFARTRKDFSVKDFGAKGDGTGDDGPALRKALVAANAAGKGARVLIPEGTYAINTTPNGGHFVILNCQDIVIQGQGKVTFLMKQMKAGIVVRQSRNIQIRGIDIDYAPLPYALGTIVAKNPKQATFDMKLHDGYPKPDSKPFQLASHLRGTVRDPKTKKIFKKAGDLRVVKVSDLGNKIYRIGVADNQHKTKPGMTAPFPIGHHYSMHAREPKGGGCAVFIVESEYVLCEAVNVYASYAHAYLTPFSSALKFINCIAEPKPGTDRVACNNADGIHCPSNRKGPYVENCRFLFLNDDCMNLYSKTYCTARVDGPRTFTLDLLNGGGPVGELKHNARFRIGDPVVFLDPRTAESEGFGYVTKLARTKWKNMPFLQITLDRDIEGILSRDKLGKGHVKGREYVGSDAKKANADKPIEHFVANLACKSDGFVIRNCLFGDNRANGIKFKACNGVMRNTTIRGDMTACSFKIALDWQEGYFPRNILLQGNHLNTTRKTSTYLGLPTPNRISPKKFIRRIDIRE